MKKSALISMFLCLAIIATHTCQSCESKKSDNDDVTSVLSAFDKDYPELKYRDHRHKHYGSKNYTSEKLKKNKKKFKKQPSKFFPKYNKLIPLFSKYTIGEGTRINDNTFMMELNRQIGISEGKLTNFLKTEISADNSYHSYPFPKEKTKNFGILAKRRLTPIMDHYSKKKIIKNIKK